MNYRPRIPRVWVVSALIRRDFLTARSYRVAFVMDLAFGLANILVYYFISRALGDLTTRNLAGAPTYFAFAAVGASMSLVIQVATAGLARRIREEQLTGTLEALAAQPVTTTEVAIGIAGFPFMFAMLRVALYVLVAGAFLDMDLGNADWVGFIIILLGSGAALGAVGVLLGSFVIAIKRGDSLIVLTSFVLTLFGGAVFPRAVLPEWLQIVTVVVPTRFAFDGVRNALFLGGAWAEEATSLFLEACVLFPLSLVAFGVAVARARHNGSLGEY